MGPIIKFQILKVRQMGVVHQIWARQSLYRLQWRS